jgi:predicted PurR-regulated permease PerM
MIDRAAAWAVAWRIVLLVVLIVLGVWLAIAVQAILLQLLVALILATGLSPLVERLHRLGLSRGGSVLMIYLLFIIALVLLAWAIVPPVVQQAESLVVEVPRFDDRALELLAGLQERFPFLPPLDAELAAQIRSLGGQIGAVMSQLLSQAVNVARVVLNVFSGLVTAVLILLLTLYLVIDGPRIQAYVLSFSPPDRHVRLGAIAEAIGRRMGGWLVGQVVLSVTVGAVTFVGLTLLGVRGASILAVIAAIGEVVPMVGPIVAAIPAVVVALTQSPGLAIATLVLYLLIQQLENNLLVPKIMEQAVELHPLAVIVAIMIGGELLGVVGALVAVPVAAAVAVVLDELRHHEGPASSLAERIEAAAGAEPAPAAASTAQTAQPAQGDEPGGQPGAVPEGAVAARRDEPGRDEGGPSGRG